MDDFQVSALSGGIVTLSAHASFQLLCNLTRGHRVRIVFGWTGAWLYQASRYDPKREGLQLARISRSRDPLFCKHLDTAQQVHEKANKKKVSLHGSDGSVVLR